MDDAILTMQENQERLAPGDGAAHIKNTDSGTFTVRVNPLSEGEITTGQSGEASHWGKEALQQAVDSGALDGATIVKGEGGANPHFPLDEQVPPENIIGKVPEWEYQDGVGPVGEADIVDEQMANRIDAGLLEVSADLLRELGEYNQEKNANDVETILGMPRITVLERGASSNASITPATAEALGVNVDGTEADDLVTQEQLAVNGVSSGDVVVWESDGGGSREPSGLRYGEVVNELPDGPEESVLVAVYQADSDYESWENRGEEVTIKAENLEVIGSNGKDSFPPISDVFGEQNAGFIERISSAVASKLRSEDVEQLGESEVNEPAESGADEEETDMPNDNLQEQLAEVKSEKEQLASQKNDLEEQLSEKEDALEDREEQLSEKEEEIENLQEDIKPLKELLAEIAADGSLLDPKSVAESNSVRSLVDMLAGGEDDKSYTEKVQEQLAGTVNPRGDADGGEDNPDEEQLAEANDRAFELINGTDVVQMSDSDLSPAEFVREQKGIDPVQFSSRESLRSAYEQKGEN